MYEVFTRLRRLLGYGGATTAVLVAGGLMSPAALDTVIEFEGGCTATVCESYVDPVGVPTIGHGHTNRAGTVRFELGDVWTREYAREVLDDDLEMFWNAVGDMVTVELTQCQQSVLTSWAYNVGTGAASRSTLVRNLNNGDYDGVPTQLNRWNRGGGRVLPGLTRRRAAEGALWISNCGEGQ